MGFPLPFLTLNTVGPTCASTAPRSRSRYFCPRSWPARSSSPSATPSRAPAPTSRRCTTTAVRDGDEWVINGQKMWTSLAGTPTTSGSPRARTPPTGPKHAGSRSSSCRPTAEGYSRQEIHTLGGVHTNATFYDDVRVPAENLIGGENNGWRLITGQLNHERISLMTVGRMRRDLSAVTEWAQPETKIDGERVIDKAWVQHNLARVHAKAEVLRLMNWKQAWAADQGPARHGRLVGHQGLRQRAEHGGVPRAAGGARRRRHAHAAGSPGAVLQGRIESSYRNGLILTFGGGTNEIQRDIIAMAGMGMPHYKD